MPATVVRSLTATQSHLLGSGITAAGVFVLSFEALLVRIADTSGWNAAFWRGSLMMVMMLFVVLWRHGPSGFRVFRRQPAAWVCGGLYGLSGFCFVSSLAHTAVANTVVLASSAPLFAALLTRVWLREAVAARTWLAIAVAFCGVAVVFAGSMSTGGWVGDVFALGAAFSLGSNFSVMRRHPGLPRFPLVFLGGAVTALLALPLADPLSLSPQGYLALALLGMVVIPIAYVGMAEGTRYLSSPEVSLFLLVEAALAPVWVWWVMGELPPRLTVLGGGLILGVLVLHAVLTLRALRRRPPAAIRV